MPRFCANLSMMFNEDPFERRFAAAAAAGFEGVEFLFPYAYAGEKLAGLLAEYGLAQVLFNAPPGNWDGGERGLACLPGRQGEFQDSVGLAIDYARTLECPQIHVMAGIPPQGIRAEDCALIYVENLRYAATEAETAGLRILVEAINTRDMPGYFLNSMAQALAVQEAVGAANLFLQYDIYHMQIMGGDLAHTIAANLPLIGHMQLADTPGRHEPGTGEINYPFLFDFIDGLGYAGWIGCEYRPAAGTLAGLDWFRPFRSE